LDVDPQGLLQAKASVYAGHPAAQGAAHGEEPAPGPGYRLQARFAECVPAVEYPGDPVCAGERQEADAALAILTQDHRQAQTGSFCLSPAVNAPGFLSKQVTAVNPEFPHSPLKI
ncbi:hypothetical protein XENOCAPTIV_024319, partial [Xenoophorus captivus]